MRNHTIVQEICAHVEKEGSGYKSWYCGIATDPKKRLFNDHCVPTEDAWWIYRDAQTDGIARGIEKYLLDLGFSGGPSGGDRSTVFVYAYKILNSTVE